MSRVPVLDKPGTRELHQGIAASFSAIDALVTRLAADSPWLPDDVAHAQALERIVAEGVDGMTGAERSSLARSLATFASHLARRSS